MSSPSPSSALRSNREIRRAWLALCLGIPAAAACTTGAVAGGALEPRFVAVHNALAAVGMTQVGPIEQGALAEGREARVRVDLAAGCTTVVAMGGEGVRDLDAELLDAQGHSVAHDTTTEPQAVVKVCVDAPGAYVLVVRAAAGAGRWVAAEWQGGPGEAPAAGAKPAAAGHEAAGTCDAPIPLTAGTVSGSTVHGDDTHHGSCDDSHAPEIVYELDVTERQRVEIEVDARFDSILYLRKEACADPDAQVECNDDDPSAGHDHSRIERVLEPGRYFVFVDGYKQAAGAYKLTVTTTDVLSLADECRVAPLLVAGSGVSGTTAGAADDAEATCGGGASGPEAAWRMELAERSRVRLVEHPTDPDAMSPVLHVRYACTDPQSETACSDSGSDAGDAAVTGVFTAGSYMVFADGRDRRKAGHYDLLLETAPPEGVGTVGEGCGDAQPLLPGGGGAAGAGGGVTGTVHGDTFAARDDVASACGGSGAPDLVYHLDVARRSRFIARFDAEEGPHLLEMWRRCGDRAAEVACGKGIDEVLAPGTYFVAIDGTSPSAFGRFRLAYTLQDLSGQAAACASAPALVPDKTVRGSTSGALDRFSSSCAGGGDALQTGPDRVFRFEVAARSNVRIVVDETDFDAALSIRRACVDAPGGPTELACDADDASSRRVTVEHTLEPGSYFAVVEGASPADQGTFSITYDAVIAR
jgi:hypothetical protein